MKKILLSGSLVYDHLFNFKGVFKDSFSDKSLDAISLCFRANSHEMRFGGCAGNIAYSLSLLNADLALFGVAGRDFHEYQGHFESLKISLENVVIDDESFTANAYILTDQEENQLGIFSPGASDNLKLGMSIADLDSDSVDLAIISPCHPKRMIAIAEACLDKNVPYIFDPGQALPVLSDLDIKFLLNKSIGVIANEYESNLISERLDLSLDDLAKNAGFLVQTCGEKGCILYKDIAPQRVDAIQDLAIVDVTGAGDAFRAGFLFGMVEGKDLKRCCEFGNTVASFSLSGNGAQLHSFDIDEFFNRLESHY